MGCGAGNAHLDSCVPIHRSCKMRHSSPLRNAKKKWPFFWVHRQLRNPAFFICPWTPSSPPPSLASTIVCETVQTIGQDTNGHSYTLVCCLTVCILVLRPCLLGTTNQLATSLVYTFDSAFLVHHAITLLLDSEEALHTSTRTSIRSTAHPPVQSQPWVSPPCSDGFPKSTLASSHRCERKIPKQLPVQMASR